MNKFTFALKWREILKSYSEDIRREVYEAIIEYAATGEIIDMKPVSRMAFDFIRYELDEKARRRAARLAKKAEAEKADSKKTDYNAVAQNSSADNNETQVPNDKPVAASTKNHDFNKITKQFYRTYTPPQPFEVNRGRIRASITADKIRLFVTRCAMDMVEAGKTPENTNNFYSELEYIVSNRIGFIQFMLSQRSPNEPLNQEAWHKMTLAARTRFAA